MKKLLTVLLIALTIAACDTTPRGNAVTGNTNANTGMGKYAGRIEIPALTDGDLFVTHTTTVNGKENVTYSISHNAERKHCRWTAFTFDPSNRAINWSRDNWDHTEWEGDPFQTDPKMPETSVMTDREIWNTGGTERFVRGHIVASYDRVYSKDANEQTFYYSNISPMNSRFNTGAWNDCESMVQTLGRSKEFCDTLYIVKGGTIREGQYRSVGRCPTVPDYYFMALLCLKDNAYKSIGLLFKHMNGESRTEVCSIDYLEDFTGIDFFCNIPDHIERNLEKSYNPVQWKGLNNYTRLD